MIPADLAPLIHQGDALELARKMPSESVQVIVTSPPYWRMRDYGVEGQWGLEDTVEEYIDRLVSLFRELRRVLRKDGTGWVNIGDTYVGSDRGNTRDLPSMNLMGNSHAVAAPPIVGHLKRKDLALVPFRLAIGLQDDGWWVREAIIWAKPNGIPEPARGRPVHAHEYILLLARSERYFYDGFAVRQPVAEETHSRPRPPDRPLIPEAWKAASNRAYDVPADGMSNLRSVWTIAMEPFGGDHFAPFPSEIPRRAILAGSSARGACAKCGAPWERKVGATGGAIGKSWHVETDRYSKGAIAWDEEVHKSMSDGTYSLRDLGFTPGCACGAGTVPCVVLDPFSGSGTTLQVARELGRRSVGFELNPAYHKISESRPGIGLPDILSWSERPHPRTVEDILGPSDGGHLLPPETVTARSRLPVVTLDAWE